MSEFVKRIRFLAAGQDDPQSRELAEERHSREVAAAKAWEFAARIRGLEAALQEIMQEARGEDFDPPSILNLIRNVAFNALEGRQS